MTFSARTRLLQMFEEVVLQKDSSRIPEYYTPDFELLTNGRRQNYEEFLHGHAQVYATAIRYAVRYDESSWVESGNRLAVRLWITIGGPGEAVTTIEVILIANFEGVRIRRLSELTWPDWTAVEAFANYPVAPATTVRTSATADRPGSVAQRSAPSERTGARSAASRPRHWVSHIAHATQAQSVGAVAGLLR